MTRDDIIRMAREAGLDVVKLSPALHEMQVDVWMRFAALVYAEGHKDGLDDFEDGVLPAAIAAEREACAKVAENGCNYPCADGIADAIRARGK